MASPIRPSFTPPPATTPSQSPGARAAQRAFFDAALGKAAPAAPTASVRPVVAEAQAQPAPRAAQPLPKLDLSTPPTRILRPGSLVDIKV